MEQNGWRMVRYADDFVILCRTEAEARDALRQVEAWVAENGLTLHPDKTRVGDSRQSGQGFEFLGYRFEAGRRLVRKKSLKALKDKVRARTSRSRGDSLERIIGDLNPMLRGWFGYFKHATPALYDVLDGFVRRRLRAILRKQEKRPGIGRCEADHRRWPNAFFAAHGHSPYARPSSRRDTPDEETGDWRAVCGRTARTVRRAGRANILPDPYQKYRCRVSTPDARRYDFSFIHGVDHCW